MLAARIANLMESPQYRHAHWGVLAVNVETGNTVYEHDADKLFAPASVTKLFSVAAALDELGADYRFRTPIYYRGTLKEGKLDGDLILRASGDLTMGGRTTPQGEIAFRDHDHTYAQFMSDAQLTEPDPLAGLNDLAAQVAAAGIREVTGQVIVDDRLFEQASSTGSGPGRLTPILINDNLVDFTIEPGQPGERAKVISRPETLLVAVDNRIDTVAAGEETEIDIHDAGGGRLILTGKMPAGRAPLVRTHEVSDPADFARGLLIEALEREGVDLDVSPWSSNPPRETWPQDEQYQQLKQVAELVSPPFAENARLILKVSHNLHASTLPLLLAAKHGERTLPEGLAHEREFLKRVGVEVDSISFGGAAGGSPADFVTPRATVQLLLAMARRDDFVPYRKALPIMGIDGTLVDVVAEKSPAHGRVQAKTGTLVWKNVLNDRFLLTSKALAGYLTTKEGETLAFAAFVNNAHIDTIRETRYAGELLGKLCEILTQ